MSLEFLKIHYLDNHAAVQQRIASGMIYPRDVRTACGRTPPDWARKTTQDEDFVTCESCLDVLVKRALLAAAEARMSSVQILERRG